MGAPIKRIVTMPKGEYSDEAKKLWNNVMNYDVDEHNITLRMPPSKVPELIGEYIYRVMHDKDHIDAKFDGKAPSEKEIYTSVHMSRSTWTRLKSGEKLDVERSNVWAAALGLRLNEYQTEELLRSAGLCTNYNIELDAALMYFIKREDYDTDKIWDILSEFSDITNGLDNFKFR